MNLEKNIKMCSLLDNYGELLGKNQFEIMSDYYYGGITLSEIADNHNITRQAVLDTIKRSETKLSNFDKKLFLIKKKSTLKSLLDEFKNGIITKEEFINKMQNEIEEI